MANVLLWSHVISQPYTDATDLKAVDVTDFVNGVLVNVINLGLFAYNNVSVATEDDITVIAPDVGPGRWLVVTPNLSAADKVLGTTGSAGTAQEITFTPQARAFASETTPSGARGILNSASAGANSDITSLTGLTTPLTVAQGGTGVTSSTGTGAVVLNNTPTLIAPLLGTPTSGVMTNVTGTAAGLTAGTVTTNANLSGPITSVGNTTSVAAQTGTGSTFVMNQSPVLITPMLGTPSSGVLTSCTGLPLTTGVVGNLPVTNLNSGTAASVGTFWQGDGTWAIPAGTGVTSVGFSVPAASIFGVTGSPITAAGTIGLTTTGTQYNALYMSDANTVSSGTNVLIGNGVSDLQITRPTPASTGAKDYLQITAAADTGLTASTEVSLLSITAGTRTWSAGTISLQREVAVTQPTYAFATSSTITNAATVGISGAPVRGTNALITNAHGLLIGAGAVGTATNSYGLTVNTQTGATNNYAAQFLAGICTAVNFASGLTSRVSAGSTFTLTSISNYFQVVTGSTTQTMVLPVTTTLVLGQSFNIINRSTGVLTVNTSGGNLVLSMAANTGAIITCLVASGTTAASWNVEYIDSSTGTVNTGAINELSYYAAAGNAVSGLATANNGVLVTSAGGVPSISSTLPSGIAATSMALTTPLLGTPTSGTLTNCTGLTVSGGGTGLASTTAYAVLCGGTSSTSALQSIASVGTSGQVLTSNGAAALPTFQGTIQSVKTQTIAATGTYTPSTGMLFCIVELYGAGAGGGSSAATIALHNNVAGGGGAGGYCKKLYTAAQLGATAAVVIGAAGTGGAAGANNAGNNGGNSTFTPAGAGAILTANGGTGGAAGQDTTTSVYSAAGAGGTATNGDVNITGGNGTPGWCWSIDIIQCGEGGGSGLTPSTGIPAGGAGNSLSGRGPGGGGTGSWLLASASSMAGGNGLIGVAYITEFCSV